MTNPDTVESELVVTFMDEDNRPECMSPPCHNEAVWRCILHHCDCFHVYCDPCRRYTEAFEAANPFMIPVCRVCNTPGGGITWERLI